MKILLRLSFVGTAYCGWQAQNNGNSIQEKLTAAASQLFGFQCDITGCSRTDSGVHANEFCATVSRRGQTELTTTVPLDKIPRAINTFLPEDISVYAATAVEDDFHPRYDVKYKEYAYYIHTRPERDAFKAGRVWHYPKRLDTDAMAEAAKHFVGKYDFAAFMAQGSKIVDTVRTVNHAEIERDGDIVVFKVAADGFLYNMVRIMVGTLISVGEKKILPSDIEGIIKGLDRKAAGITAPACGLYLNRVVY